MEGVQAQVQDVATDIQYFVIKSVPRNVRCETGLVWFGVNYDMGYDPSRDYSVALCIILMFT